MFGGSTDAGRRVGGLIFALPSPLVEVARMGFYLAERYVPSMSAADVGAAIDRLDRAVSDEPVRHVLSVLVHGEDTCLSIFEAPDPQAIERVTARAGFPL